ncbi:GTP pyrophosphokinase [Citricoccus nitrophenolicus]|uniref:GTP pyrophosphokinase n=1 Tax=Citricoccus nitrophenolicus TaxID=863575 RepID=UPI0031EBFA77
MSNDSPTWSPEKTYTAYVSAYAEYEAALEEICADVVGVLQRVGVTPHQVNSRPKDPISLLHKQRKKAYADPWVQCKDILGIRVIVALASDKQRVRDALSAPGGPFSVEKIEDKEAERDYRELRYGGLHMDIVHRTVQTSLAPSVACEVQIRTIAEHTWAETEHAYIYKGPGEIPSATKRQFARVLALVELMDSELDRGVEAVSSLVSYENLKLNQRLTTLASQFGLSAGSIELTIQNVEELVRVTGRRPNELRETLEGYLDYNAETIKGVLARIGPRAARFDIRRHILAAQPEMLLVASLLEENPYQLGSQLEQSDLLDLVKPIAREMGKGQAFSHG